MMRCRYLTRVFWLLLLFTFLSLSISLAFQGASPLSQILSSLQNYPPPITDAWDSTSLETLKSQNLSHIPQGCRSFLFGPWTPTNILSSLPKSVQIHTPNSDPTVMSQLSLSVPSVISYLHYNEHLSTHRYLCSIESAARHNPNHLIVIHAKNVTDFEEQLKVWRKGIVRSVEERVKVVELDYGKYFRETPLWEWYQQGKHLKSRWVEQNLGNGYRLALLWHKGGAYMDLDIININRLDGLGRMLAKEDSGKINNAALQFPPKDAFVWDLMEEFVRKFNGMIWANNGPVAVTRTFRATCPASSLLLMQSPKNKNNTDPNAPDAPECTNLKILPSSVFYPIHFLRKGTFTDPWQKHCKLLGRMQSGSVGLHWWHKLVPDGTRIPREGFLGKVMEVHCPNVVRDYEGELKEGDGVKEREKEKEKGKMDLGKEPVVIRVPAQRPKVVKVVVKQDQRKV
ncbi:Lactosylceramide 4-alpha-galactosyltransferase [Rhizophlyctis rosea]|uniref:Lactosylceramide 4-alpha-galactosyltransferase n=1 Tax=Rhizophlyctis rosea TaxID=64517 RepID=A0AAD5SMI2_9FUNG|nr:Lactosylceramide 4-alpha-galactosyltransferase [Rhizophlyctis rosea]